MAAEMAPRRIVVVSIPGAQTLDVVGPVEVFSAASRIAGGAPYDVELVAPGADPFVTSSGLRLLPDRPISRCRGRIDTLIVGGGAGVAQAEHDEELIGLLRSAAGRSRRVASVCNGAFLLARAGLVDGRRVTTHWASCEELAARYPGATVESDPIFVRDNELWTSAGVTAGMDLALALVEDDLGREVSLEVARWLVLFVRRPGGQSQFSAQLQADLAERAPLRELQSWIAENIDSDLRVEALAERACMSPRNFARAFRREVGSTPGAYVESVRVEAARHALERGGEAIDQIARRCGFGTPETMRRAFHRRLGVGPAEYRDRFRSALEPAA
jgi:transcriptional regulator GlxA family with amidase domain